MGTANTREPHINVVIVAKPKMLTGLNQKVCGIRTNTAFTCTARTNRVERCFARSAPVRQQMMTLLGNLPACTVVMEACVGAHFVARELMILGHQARLISSQFVRPFVKGNKNYFVDAEAICEAASRTSMHFVSSKTEAQQTLSVLHRLRESQVRDRTKTANQMHGFLAGVWHQSAQGAGDHEALGECFGRAWAINGYAGRPPVPFGSYDSITVAKNISSCTQSSKNTSFAIMTKKS